VTFALLIVAGFGIYNIMSMTVANKLKDIAILGAQGFRSKDIVTIFLSQSLFIGIVGALLGLSLGFVLAYGLSKIPFPQSDLISLKYFPVLFKIKYYAWGMAFGILTTVVAGLMPSVKASKLDPVIILRG
jgi:lipoprotein-releasing system permease protein